MKHFEKILTTLMKFIYVIYFCKQSGVDYLLVKNHYLCSPKKIITIYD